MLSEQFYLQPFGADRLAAMSQEQLEQALAWAKQRVIEFGTAQKERERLFNEEGILINVKVFDRMCYGDVMFYGIELELRKRPLNEDRFAQSRIHFNSARNVRRTELRALTKSFLGN